MANCVKCGASNLGMGRTDLVIVDETWYCNKCLKSTLGDVSCSKCGNQPFRSGEHFKTIGALISHRMHGKTRINEEIRLRHVFGDDQAKSSPTTQAPRSLDALGSMKDLLQENLEPGEE